MSRISKATYCLEKQKKTSDWAQTYGLRLVGGRPTNWTTVTKLNELSGFLAEFGRKKHNTDGYFTPST